MSTENEALVAAFLDMAKNDPDKLAQMLKERGFATEKAKTTTRTPPTDLSPLLSSRLSPSSYSSSPTLSPYTDHYSGTKAASSSVNPPGPISENEGNWKTSMFCKIWRCFLCPSCPPDEAIEGEWSHHEVGKYSSITVAKCCVSHYYSGSFMCCGVLPASKNSNGCECIGYWGDTYWVPALCCLIFSPLPCCWYKVEGNPSSNRLEINGKLHNRSRL
eukprot:TRINITY_DN2423_c0_g1_i1.p1 TRINITY_DN2423_c0_g1~~TRINITY_DN2423_c0_g1_i1.p1  ORF type:complete len:237 (-),score=46.57 TRINITY_DN2423_c0_g1_i1:158-808(-)